MNALERIPDHTPGPFDDRLELRPVVRSSDQFDRMANWLDLFMRTAEVAKVLARTNFVPAAMHGEPENIAAAMMRSLELGIDPLDGLANLYVVKGRVGHSAEFMRRRILEAGHELVIDESTDERCKIRGRRAGTQEWQTVAFTADQARKAKIDISTYPADKLVARASSRLCRRVFPDVLAGATIIEDVIDVESEDVKPSGSVQRKRQPRSGKLGKVTTEVVRPSEATPADIDELLDDPGQGSGNDVSQGAELPSGATTVASDSRDQDPRDRVGAEHSYKGPDFHGEQLLGTSPLPLDDTPDEPITPAQLTKLSILLKEAGFNDRDSRHEFVTAAIGHPINSSKELTKQEASNVIEVLSTPDETQP